VSGVEFYAERNGLSTTHIAMNDARHTQSNRLTAAHHRAVIPGFSISAFPLKAVNHEAHLSTFQNASQAHARLSRAHENQGRARRNQRAPSQGAGAARCLIHLCPVPKRAGVLRKRRDFEVVLQSRLRVVTPNFVARASPNELGHARLGIIAGRKAAARAVDRNRGKRLIREAFRAGSAALGAYDVTVQLRNDLRSQHNSLVQAELRDLMRALGRRCSAGAAYSAAPTDRQ
jgi:ribonuclease P protein component